MSIAHFMRLESIKITKGSFRNEKFHEHFYLLNESYCTATHIHWSYGIWKRTHSNINYIKTLGGIRRVLYENKLHFFHFLFLSLFMFRISVRIKQNEAKPRLNTIQYFHYSQRYPNPKPNEMNEKMRQKWNPNMMVAQQQMVVLGFVDAIISIFRLPFVTLSLNEL